MKALTPMRTTNKAVKRAGENADEHRRDDDGRQGQMRLAGEKCGEHRGAAKHRPDREVEFACRQREGQAQ